MSLDVYLEKVVTEKQTVFTANITHNMNVMAQKAGLYEACWRPEEKGWTHARDLIEPLRTGLANLKTDPDLFRPLEPENGWGDYAGLVGFVEKYLDACMKHPDAEVKVWR